MNKEIPGDCVLIIFGFSKFRDVLRYSLVCRNWLDLSKSQLYWKNTLRYYFPSHWRLNENNEPKKGSGKLGNFLKVYKIAFVKFNAELKDQLAEKIEKNVYYFSKYGRFFGPMIRNKQFGKVLDLVSEKLKFSVVSLMLHGGIDGCFEDYFTLLSSWRRMMHFIWENKSLIEILYTYLVQKRHFEPLENFSKICKRANIWKGMYEDNVLKYLLSSKEKEKDSGYNFDTLFVYGYFEDNFRNVEKVMNIFSEKKHKSIMEYFKTNTTMYKVIFFRLHNYTKWCGLYTKSKGLDLSWMLDFSLKKKEFDELFFKDPYFHKRIVVLFSKEKEKLLLYSIEKEKEFNKVLFSSSIAIVSICEKYISNGSKKKEEKNDNCKKLLFGYLKKHKEQLKSVIESIEEREQKRIDDLFGNKHNIKDLL